LVLHITGQCFVVHPAFCSTVDFELLTINQHPIKMSASAELDEQIERLRKGDTLGENEVKALCEKVRARHNTHPANHGMRGERRHFVLFFSLK
jgi:hypothetical protein